MTLKPSYDSAIQRLRDARRILVVSHANPDGDAIGSTLAFGVGLKQLGKQVIMYNQDKIPFNLQFLPHLNELTNKLPLLSDIDLVVMLDCSQPKRIGEEFEKMVSGVTCMYIDHHLGHVAPEEGNCIDPKAASTSTLIYKLLKLLSVQMTTEIATLVYTGLVMDTGFFKYSNTTAEVLELAAELVRLGASPADVSQSALENAPPAQLRLLSLVLETLEFHFDGQCASLVLTKQMLEEAGATSDMAEGFIAYARGIAGVEVAALIREQESKRYKISLRSKKTINVADLAAQFGGGGHKHAAGCTIEKTTSRSPFSHFGRH